MTDLFLAIVPMQALGLLLCTLLPWVLTCSASAVSFNTVPTWKFRQPVGMPLWTLPSVRGIQIVFKEQVPITLPQHIWVIDWILAKFFFCVVMDRDEVKVHKHAKKERGQYPAIFTEQAWSIKDL